MSARKIALLVLIVAFAASVETAWNVRGDIRLGPEGCRVMGGRFYGPSWSFETRQERALAAAPRLEVENEFGSVSVKPGAAGSVKVRLRKVVFLATEEKARAFAERIELRLTGDDARLKVATNRDELAREDTGFETHLEIEAPKDALVTVRNEHGRVELAGVAGADVDSSFDGVKVGGVAGDVKLDVSHGDVEVDGVGGGLVLKARHGSVEVASIAGAAKLDVEHGDAELHRSGRLQVEIAQGTLTIDGVDGELVVRGQHAPVHGSDVTGKADVETSFGDVRLERVGGDLRAHVEHGGVTASDVAGAADVASAFGDITLERVSGRVEAEAQHGGIAAKGLAHGGRVRAVGGDVALDGFAGPLELEVERGSARLAPAAALEGGIVARVSQGELRLAVAEGSRFELAAESSRGRVDAPFDGITVEDVRHRGQRASGRHAGGGVSVRLTADGDVTLESRAERSRDDWAVARPRLDARPAAEAPTSAASPAPKPSPTAATRPKAPPETQQPQKQTSPDGATDHR